MITLQRYSGNPIVTPNPEHAWEHDGAFNGCVAEVNGTYHMVYRALSSPLQHEGTEMRISSVGYTQSNDGKSFGEHRQILAPTEDWEIYGCEDPRITYFNGAYYIFYTALSSYPFAAYGIKLALAKTTDFQTFEKHPVTTFNSKAMALFPEKINGKMAALLTIHTDLPPAKIALALFDNEEDIWSPHYWDEWYDNVNSHLLHLLLDLRDQVELGSPPVKTPDGWLVIYSYIKNYMTDSKIFGIEAVLLDLNDPRKIIGRTTQPLLKPDSEYERSGDVPNIAFPSGAVIKDDMLSVYYGAADTRCALATCKVEDILKELRPVPAPIVVKPHEEEYKLVRYEGNPIIKPVLELDWQAKAIFNPAAIYEDGKIHIVYRAQSMGLTSVFGYASTRDGFHIDENLDYPIYVPREQFEKNDQQQYFGCEDPRMSKIGDRFYVTYTAYDGKNPPRVAITSIKVSDFLAKKWDWELPKIISLPGVDDKDACIVEGKKGTFIAFHRLGDSIWLEVLKDLNFDEHPYLAGTVLVYPRTHHWDNVKLGISGPPLETEKGWLLIYHGVSQPGYKYKVGAILLDLYDPLKILGRTDTPILEPEMPYEIVGQIPNVVFPCGEVIMNDQLFVYYGGADSVLCVATMPIKKLLDHLLGK